MRKHKLTAEEYLTIERAANYKSEYFSGEMFAMSGATTEHVQITFNLSSEMRVALKGRECQGLGSDMRLRVTQAAYTYPDLMVVCGEMIHVDNQFDTLTNPTLIFEVLSESTEGYDRGEKFALYPLDRNSAAICADFADKRRVEWFTLQPDGHWMFGEANGPEGVLELPALSCEIPLSEIYDRVIFEETDEPAA